MRDCSEIRKYLLIRMPNLYAALQGSRQWLRRVQFFLKRSMPQQGRAGKSVTGMLSEHGTLQDAGEMRWRYACRLNEVPVQCELRKNDSDHWVANQVFIQQEYRPVLRIMQCLGLSAPRIIDGGGNIGLTSIFFKAHLPGAALLCIEPSPANAGQAALNFRLNGMEEISLIQKALWNRTGFLLEPKAFGDNLSWSFAVEEAAGMVAGSLQATSLQECMKLMGWEKADLLKLDIEGSEAVLFRDEKTFQFMTSNFRIIATEIHPTLISPASVKKQFRKKGWVLFEQGELTIAFNPHFT